MTVLNKANLWAVIMVGRHGGSAVKGFQYIGYSIIRAHLIPGFHNLSLFIYQKRRADNPFIFFTIHGLLTPDTILVGHLMIAIRQQGKPQFMLFVKFFLDIRGIRADTCSSHI